MMQEHGAQFEKQTFLFEEESLKRKEQSVKIFPGHRG
jgi:hypothetical protein